MKKIYIFIFLFSFFNLFSQKGVVTTGGNATGPSGNASFSVGIISYKNPDGTLQNTGIQNAYEVFTLGISELTNDQLNLITYPNPVNNLLKIKVDEQLLYDLVYEIIDLSGKILKTNQQITSSETLINFENYTSGIYFIIIKRENQKIKNFKIIKN